MCGITGIWDISGTAPDALGRQLRAMTDMLAHRGPDDSGAWLDEAAGIGLGFRRLSIIDLSPAGHQPMVSASGRFVICFNGEVYNAPELRRELSSAGIAWRGHSDTEAVLEACARWSVDEALPKLIGMFAFALWDRQSRRLVLARDRLGKKPLYWSETRADGASLVLFGSELRALMAHPRLARTLDRDAIALYLRHGYFPQPHTIFAGVHQLAPGHRLVLEAGRAISDAPFWSLADVAAEGRRAPFSGSETDATDALDALLRDAVSRRMVADVPLGAFLSGGYDSSLVVALMQQLSSRPVRTFTVGFREAGYDEATHAKAVARHLGTHHTEAYVTAQEAQDVIARLPDIYDEPFADASQIPTYLISGVARRHVTVALSGDGGDELFAGYNRYAQARLFQRYSKGLPQAPRRAVAAMLAAVPPAGWDGFFAAVPRRYRPAAPGDKMQKLSQIIGEDGDGFYRKLTSNWLDPEAVVPGSREPSTVIDDPRVREIVPDFIERMLYRDTLSYLPGDILTKVDRASMAVSLEARTPLLDHRVVAFAWRLPMAMKLKGGERKWLLRQVLYRYVPRTLVDRPKMGFGVPIGEWLRGPLRAWADDLLEERALADGGVFAAAPIRKRWSEHLAGRRNWQSSLWTVLMFEAWRRRWLRSGG